MQKKIEQSIPNDDSFSANALAIQTTKLAFSYEDSPIFSGLDLQLDKGQMVGLIGPNGAGKSTLLRLLLGIMKPESGDITIMERPLARVRRRDLARLITLVPQDSQINYAFSVEDVVAMGRNPWLDRFQPASVNDLAIIENAMLHTDVLRFAKRSINQLSGGERQRVLIARAIAQQTPIILLDEATANLDICHQLEVLELAQSLAKQGRLVVAAIHDLAMASRFCDRLLLLAQQQLQDDGAPHEVITEQNLKHFFNLHAQVRPSSICDTNIGGRRGLVINPIGAVKTPTNRTTTTTASACHPLANA